MEQLPYETGNRSLAMALHVGGCRIIDIWRIVTPDDLISHGVTEDQAIRTEGIGAVRYYIERGPNLDALIAAFDSVAKSEEVNLEKVSDEDAARIVHLALKLRADVVKTLRKPACVKFLTIKGEATVQRGEDGSLSVTHPGLTLRSGNASPKIKAKLK